MCRAIFVTGGVISGIGKGVIAASIAALLKSRGYRVSVLKFDPYLNIDPGVLSPYEHGEVYVTEDGLETDLDLGHYERFMNQSLTGASNLTSGRIFQKIMRQERQGFYNGKTVQMVPHFTNEVREYIESLEQEMAADFLICEVGGTVGDVESDPYLMAINSYVVAHPTTSALVHITYVPYLRASNEYKTKPTQFSLINLHSKGLMPHMLILRCEREVPQKTISKTANFSGIPINRVIPLQDLDQVYSCPMILENLGVGRQLLEHFGLPDRPSDFSELETFVAMLRNDQRRQIVVALIAKYIGFPDAYKSILEALLISSAYKSAAIEYRWIDSGTISDSESAKQLLKDVDGVVIMPGFGARGFEGKVIAATVLQEMQIPTLGLCLGFQAMVVAQARRCGISDAHSREFAEDSNCQHTYVLDLIDGQGTRDLGATLRLGSTEITLTIGSHINKWYGQSVIYERHRHRYNVMAEHVSRYERNGFAFTGYDSQDNLIESCELINHPFYIGVQYHPEFRARPLDPHPLFNGFIQTILSLRYPIATID